MRDENNFSWSLDETVIFVSSAYNLTSDKFQIGQVIVLKPEEPLKVYDMLQRFHYLLE